MGRLQPRLAWDHKIYNARKLGKPLPSATTGNTHAPGPGGMPTGCIRYLPPWPLCTVYARKGLTTYWTVPYLRQGQVVLRNKYGGHWNKTRSTADSGGPSIHCMICITDIFPLTDRITARQTSSCHTGQTRLNEEFGTSSCLPKTTTFPASFRYAWKAHEDDHYHQHIHF